MTTPKQMAILKTLNDAEPPLRAFDIAYKNREIRQSDHGWQTWSVHGLKPLIEAGLARREKAFRTEGKYAMYYNYFITAEGRELLSRHSNNQKTMEHIKSCQ